MKVKMRLSSLLRQFGELDSEAEVTEIETVADITPLDCLREVAARHTSIHKWLYDEDGKLRPVIFVFVNGQKLLSDEMSKPLEEGDEVFVVLSFAGG